MVAGGSQAFVTALEYALFATPLALSITLALAFTLFSTGLQCFTINLAFTTLPLARPIAFVSALGLIRIIFTCVRVGVWAGPGWLLRRWPRIFNALSRTLRRS